MIPSLTGESADRLRVALRRAGYHAAGVRALLGDEAHDALARREPVPALRASAAVDIRPCGERWVISDVAPARAADPPGPDYVPGIGPASISLARATIRWSPRCCR